MGYDMVACAICAPAGGGQRDIPYIKAGSRWTAARRIDLDPPKAAGPGLSPARTTSRRRSEPLPTYPAAHHTALSVSQASGPLAGNLEGPAGAGYSV